ncbi:MAG: EamA family transporter [Actinomycetia bacterium]|nr:EamA family transporter [Actinomycetes bacterium]
MSDSRTTQGMLLALAGAALWGITGAIAAGVFDVVSPAHVSQARSIIAVMILAPYAAYRGVLRPPKPLRKFMLLGVNLALVNVTFYWALDLLGVGPGATVQFLAPIMVLAWFAVVRGYTVGPIVWIAAVGAVIGVALVTQAWALEGTAYLGFVAGLFSAVLFASYLLFGEHLSKSHPPTQIATWGFVFASVLWLIVLPPWTFPWGIDAGTWVDIVIIGVFGTAVPFIFGFHALRLAPSGFVGVAATAEPAISAISAVVLLGQRLDPIQWFGVATVVVAVATVQKFGLGELRPPAPMP